VDQLEYGQSVRVGADERRQFLGQLSVGVVTELVHIGMRILSRGRFRRRDRDGRRKLVVAVVERHQRGLRAVRAVEFGCLAWPASRSICRRELLPRRVLHPAVVLDGPAAGRIGDQRAAVAVRRQNPGVALKSSKWLGVFGYCSGRSP